MLRECHDNPATGGHPGRRRTYEKVSASYHWQTLKPDVNKWVRDFDGVSCASESAVVALIIVMFKMPVMSDTLKQGWAALMM